MQEPRVSMNQRNERFPSNEHLRYATTLLINATFIIVSL